MSDSKAMWTRNKGGVFGDGNLFVLSRALSKHKTPLPKHISIPSVEHLDFGSHLPF